MAESRLQRAALKLSDHFCNQVGFATSTAEDWQALSRRLDLPFEEFPSDLADYLQDCLFDALPDATFELYTLKALQEQISNEDLFHSALELRYLPLADRDGDFYAYHLDTNAVHLIPGWSFTERKLDIEKKYKTLNSWVSAMARTEKAAAKMRADEEAEAQRLAANPNAVDRNGHHKLWKGLLKGNPEAVRAEIARGANLDQPDYQGITPMHYAIMVGNHEILEILLDSGANKNAKTGSGCQARELAESYGREEVMEICDRYDVP